MRFQRQISTFASDEGVELAALSAPLAAFQAQFPDHYPVLIKAVAPRVANKIETLVDTVDIELASLSEPLAWYQRRFPEQYPGLVENVSRRIGRNIGAYADDDAVPLSTVSAPLDWYQERFPKRFAGLVNEFAPRLARRIKAQADAAGVSVAALSEPLEWYRERFPGQYPALAKDVAQSVGRAITLMAEDEQVDIAALARPLTEFKGQFSDQYAVLSAEIAARLAKRVADLAEVSPINVRAVEGPLASIAALAPAQKAVVAKQVGGRFAQRLQRVSVSTPKQVAAIGKPLADFRSLFREQYPRVRDTLAERVAKRVRELAPKNVRSADALKRAAMQVLPGAQVLAAIRLELPLEEIQAAQALLRQGKLSAAAKMLDTALAVDPEHSDIAPFQQLLQGRKDKALAHYNKYVKYTLEKRSRSGRKQLIAAAKKVWSDNPAFVTVAERRAGLCMRRLAGLGKTSICHDNLAKRRKGPLLVVIPPGNGSKRPYAIGKYEVSVAEFNLYCKASKKCKARPRKTAKLPITGINIEAAKAYAAWLSQRASATEKRTVLYRLPTEAEWEHATSGAGEQPRSSDVNCRVMSGGIVIAGHALKSVRAGKQNGWGLVNYVGNAQEWVVSADGSVSARGSAYRDQLASCDASVSKPHDGAADEVTSFRLVRELG